MPINVTMPALSPTMEEGTLAKWLVKEGDKVSPGDVIAEIETDKATMEVEAVDEGKIGKILVAEGSEGVKVNAVIAVLLQEGESADAAAAAPAAPKADAEAPAAAEDDAGGKARQSADEPTAKADSKDVVAGLEAEREIRDQRRADGERENSDEATDRRHHRGNADGLARLGSGGGGVLGAMQLGKHARHGGRHGCPQVGAVRLADRHADVEDDEALRGVQGVGGGHGHGASWVHDAWLAVRGGGGRGAPCH